MAILTILRILVQGWNKTLIQFLQKVFILIVDVYLLTSFFHSMDIFKAGSNIWQKLTGPTFGPIHLCNTRFWLHVLRGQREGHHPSRVSWHRLVAPSVVRLRGLCPWSACSGHKAPVYLWALLVPHFSGKTAHTRCINSDLDPGAALGSEMVRAAIWCHYTDPRDVAYPVALSKQPRR